MYTHILHDTNCIEPFFAISGRFNICSHLLCLKSPLILLIFNFTGYKFVKIKNQLHDYILKYTISNEFTRFFNNLTIAELSTINIAKISTK